MLVLQIQIHKLSPKLKNLALNCLLVVEVINRTGSSTIALNYNGYLVYDNLPK